MDKSANYDIIYDESSSARIFVQSEGQPAEMYLGSASVRGGIWALCYDEDSRTGMEGTHTRVQASGARVTVSRTGSCSHTLIFEEGKAHSTELVTPHGSIDAELKTQSLRVTASAPGVAVELCYTLSLCGSEGESKKLKISAELI